MKKILFLVWITLSACSTVKISGVEQSGDFLLSKYSTFNFVDVVVQGDALSPNSETNLNLLKEAITKELTQRGLSKTSDNADLLVNIGVVVTEEVQTRETNFANPADRTVYMGQRNYSWKSQEVAVGTYRQGAVTVDLVDRANNELVWKGTAESVLPSKQKNIPSLIEEGMEKLFAKLK
jgi:hypothetical protein